MQKLTAGISLVFEPHIVCIAETALNQKGLAEMLTWVQLNVPDAECEKLDALWGKDREFDGSVGDGELLVELAGRSCYHSFGAKAGKKDNASYIARLMGEPGKIPHGSVLYHAKMSFFIAGISRRVAKELIRHYVGADRDVEGSPSQQSTRYTHHDGSFAVHPRDFDVSSDAVKSFAADMQQAYQAYVDYIEREIEAHKKASGSEPKGMDRKRIYECAAGRLPQQACTSLVWTTNPVALAKLFRERCDEAADLEFQKLANMWKELAYSRWPNLFRESNPATT